MKIHQNELRISQKDSEQRNKLININDEKTNMKIDNFVQETMKREYDFLSVKKNLQFHYQTPVEISISIKKNLKILMLTSPTNNFKGIFCTPNPSY